jgi:hypothetical protein
MVFDLTCVTDVAAFCVCDPSAVPDLLRSEPRADLEPIRAEAARGNLLAYSYGDDGDLRVRVYVEEPVPSELEAHAELRASGLLRVPRGRLVACGVEELAGAFVPKHAGVHALPAGNYEVAAFSLAGDWMEAKEEEAEAAAAKASPVGHGIMNLLGPSTGCLVLLTLICLGFVTCGADMLRAASPDDTLWGFVKHYGPWLVAAWALVLALWQLPPVKRANRAHTKKQEEIASLVIRLTRLPDDADVTGRSGCAFGDGFGV